MKTRICVAVVALMAASAFGQQPQPGDIPAPVVDVFETGILEAFIVAPPTVRAGAIITLDVSGTSDGDVDLTITPHVPEDAIVYDSGEDLIYVAIAVAGDYRAIWTVETGSDIAAAAVKFVAVDSGVPIPPKPPDPADTAFVKWVRVETAKVEAANHDTVAATFRTLAARIEAGELQGSAAINAATKKALFGTAGTKNAAWGPWYNVVFARMIGPMRLMTQEQWATAYNDVAKGVTQ